jgi:serine/threonine protein phosphatase PrpC/CRP-like cAMP-binding protein
MHARTDVGRSREHNEDSYVCDPVLGLYAVADGMGGHAAGEVASSLAAEALSAAVRRDHDFVADFAHGDGSVRPEDIKNLLGAAVNAANAEVYAAAQAVAERRGMGTTLTALLLVERRAFIAHVGDSRLYLVRGSEVRQLTEDHSVINELKRRGRLRPEVLERIPNKNAVTRAVGVFETVEVDTFQVLAAPGDRFVLCSDGLHRYFEHDSDLAALAQGDDEEAAARMIAFANERGGADNITAIVVTLPDESASSTVVQDLTHAYTTLGAVPFFRNLEPRELMYVQALAAVRELAAGECVVAEGRSGDSMFVMLSGRCSVKKGDVEIARLASGEHFGEMAMVERAPRSATVVVEEDASLLEFTRADLFRVLRESKDTGIKLLWNIITALAGRLRDTSTQLGEAREALAAEDLTAHLFIEEFHSEAPPMFDAAMGYGGSREPGARDTLPLDASPSMRPIAPAHSVSQRSRPRDE